MTTIRALLRLVDRSSRPGDRHLFLWMETTLIDVIALCVATAVSLRRFLAAASNRGAQSPIPTTEFAFHEGCCGWTSSPASDSRLGRADFPQLSDQLRTVGALSIARRPIDSTDRTRTMHYSSSRSVKMAAGEL